MMKSDLETTLEAFAMLEDKARIEALETLVKKLNKELWILRRLEETTNE